MVLVKNIINELKMFVYKIEVEQQTRDRRRTSIDVVGRLFL